jgi:hypothetical protein
MVSASTIWLNRLLLRDVDSTARPVPTDGKPMEIEVERLPDRQWRDLGFAPARRSGQE